jgi:hypothetical protein
MKKVILVEWKPTETGKYREVIEWKWNRQKLRVVVIGSCVDSKKPSASTRLRSTMKTTRPLSPKTPLKSANRIVPSSTLLLSASKRPPFDLFTTSPMVQVQSLQPLHNMKTQTHHFSLFSIDAIIQSVAKETEANPASVEKRKDRKIGENLA